MKKTILTLSVLLAAICGTLVYATTNLSQSINTNSIEPCGMGWGETTTSDPTEPVTDASYGKSIGTVDAQLYSGSGLNLSYFGYANYVTGPIEGTYLGFRTFQSTITDTITGEVTTFDYVGLSAISSSADAVTIPDSIKVGEKTYPVKRIDGSNSYLRYGFTDNIKILTVPETVDYIDRNYSFDQYLSAMYMLGAAPTIVNTNSMQVPVLYVCDKTYLSSYLNNSKFSSSFIQPYGWDFDWMIVNVGRKGEFAQTYIEMTDANWSAGMNVKITGTLNTTDLQNIKNLSNLRKLDLSEAEFTSLPSSFLENKSSLMEVILPESFQTLPNSAFSYCTKLTKVVTPGLKTIGESALYNCYKLSEFDISTVTSIGNSAFYNCSSYNPTQLSNELRSISNSAFAYTGLTEISLPETMKIINSSVFSNCKKLTKVTLPSTITSIESSAFNNCYSLTEINLPEGLSTISSSAFYNCSSLSELVIPSTLQSMGSNALYGCSSLLSIKCKAIVPPVASSSFTGGIDMNHSTLYIAPFAIDAYRAAQNWSNFYIMKPLNEPVKNIYINRPMTFDLLSEDNAVLQENPNMTLDYSSSNYVGQLSASGDGTLSAGVFSIFHSFARRYNGNIYDYRTTLINNAENMRADSVMCSILFEKNYWHFISFQYDVQMKDIYGLNNTDFVIRQYNSENRASGDGSMSNWESVPTDGVLKAGKGYIIQAANNSTNASGNTYSAVVRFPSRNTVTKNRLFTPNNVIVPLDEYPAEFAHNRSWNLVGNPYPCYYDMHYLMDNFTTPIVLWRGTSYQAYSPVDDDIILRPNEAFFVQRPLDADQMVFGAEGRMHYNDAYIASYYDDITPGIYSVAANIQTSSSRSVFNFNVEGNGNDDRARIVINEEASMDYELNCDASKFFAEAAQGIEIFVDGDIKYDICERPLENGIATLGIRVAQNGTYNLNLNGRNTEGWSVLLTDTKADVTVDLTESGYQFDAEAGTDSSRFIVTLKAPGTTSLNDIEASRNDVNVQVINTSGVVVFEGNIDQFKTSANTGIYIVVDFDKAYKIVIK